MEKKWENIGIIIYLLFVMLYHAIRFILVSKGLEYRAAVQICSNIVMWGIPPIYAAFKIKKVIVLVILAIPALFAGFLVLWFVFGNIATEQKLDAGLLEVSIPNFPKATITEYYEAVYFLARRKLESGPERDIRLLRYKYNIDFTQAEDEKGKYISGTYPQVQVIVTEEGNDDYIEKYPVFILKKLTMKITLKPAILLQTASSVLYSKDIKI